MTIAVYSDNIILVNVIYIDIITDSSEFQEEEVNNLKRNNIEAARIAKGYTRPDLAKIVGVTPGSVFGWERGRTNPELATAIRVADALEVTLDYLLGRSSA